MIAADAKEHVFAPGTGVPGHVRELTFTR